MYGIVKDGILREAERTVIEGRLHFSCSPFACTISPAVLLYNTAFLCLHSRNFIELLPQACSLFIPFLF